MNPEGHVFRTEVVTLFPSMIEGYLAESILRRAREMGKLQVRTVNLRDYGIGRHRVTDDEPYGGGAGMVMKPEPFFGAMDDLRSDGHERVVVLLSPQGQRFTQAHAETLARDERIITFLCGRYEGVDERIRENLADRELSLGDFVLTGGELAALAIIDAAVRLVPGVLGDAASSREDSFAEGLLEYPQYTRPPEYRGLKVPDILFSGHHEEVRRWRRREALRRTLMRRPDLLGGGRQEDGVDLSPEDRRILERLRDNGPAHPSGCGDSPGEEN